MNSSKTVVEQLVEVKAEAEALKAQLTAAQALTAATPPHNPASMSVRAHLAPPARATAPATGSTPPATTNGKPAVSAGQAGAIARRDFLRSQHDAITGANPRHTARLQQEFRNKNRLEMDL